MKGVPFVFYVLTVKDIWGDVRKNRLLLRLMQKAKHTKDDVQTERNCISFIERKESLAGDLVQKAEVIMNSYEQLTVATSMLLIDLDIIFPLRRVSGLEGIIKSTQKRILILSMVWRHLGEARILIWLRGEEDGSYKNTCHSAFTARQ